MLTRSTVCHLRYLRLLSERSCQYEPPTENSIPSVQVPFDALRTGVTWLRLDLNPLHRADVLTEKLTVPQLVKKSRPVMGPECSLPFWNHLFLAVYLKYSFIKPHKCTSNGHISMICHYDYMFRHVCAILYDFIHFTSTAKTDICIIYTLYIYIYIYIYIDSRWCHWIFQWHISFRPYHSPGVDSSPSNIPCWCYVLPLLTSRLGTDVHVRILGLTKSRYVLITRQQILINSYER